MKINRIIQLILAKWLNEPEIPDGKTTGYSLVRSEKSHCKFGKDSYAIAPFLLTNVELGEHSYIARNAQAANLIIGKYCSIGPNFCCGLGIHPLDGLSTSPCLYPDGIEEHKPVFIGNDVFIGANVTILDGVTIGDGAVIGAGAVVNKDIPPYAIAVGVPAKVIKYRFDKQTQQKLLADKWWDKNDEEIQNLRNRL